jgi:hypothetical protein
MSIVFGNETRYIRQFGTPKQYGIMPAKRPPFGNVKMKLEES